MMDLLSTLSAMPAALNAAPSFGASSRSDGKGSSSGDGTSFLETLAGLLGPPASDGGDSEALAQAVAALDADEVEVLEQAVTDIWPLVAMLEPEADPAASAGAVVAAGEDVADDRDGSLLAEALTATDTDEVTAGSDEAAGDGSVDASPLASEAGTTAHGVAGSGPDPADTDHVAPQPAPATSDVMDGDAAGARATPLGAAVQGVADDGDAPLAVTSSGATPDESDSSRSDAGPQRSAPRAESVADGSRSSAGPTPDTNLAASTSSAGPRSQAPAMGDGIRRVLEAIELLENAPPPRQLTIEVGEGRLRVAIEDGHVRLSAVDGGSEDLDELIRTAEDALAEHGFDLGGDGPRDQPSDEHQDPVDRPRSRSERSEPRGLRL